ncbi:MAG: polysaccharide deacetylase family protein [Candidatus Thiodiazotropha sp.]|jgi:polysaccharide deacetylase family protein (PEP-CTERM system associated)
MNILTFDVEEWFHILDNDSTKSEKQWLRYEHRLNQNMERIFELLERKQQKATFFCLGWVAREYPNIVKRIHSQGYEIATHSDKHQLAYNQNISEFTEDLKCSIGSIEDITSKKVYSYRAPGFSLKEENKWVFDILQEYGIEVDCSIFPADRAHGGFPSFGHAKPAWVETNGTQIKEFPINLYKIFGKNLIFSGGGYFRLLPYWLITQMTTHSEYVMTYFHPRDFDATQPVIKDISFARKFKSYYGLGSAFQKLEKLITDFNFIDLETAVSKVDWDDAPVIKI